MRPGYIVTVIPPKGATPEQAETLWRLAHATFTKAMHERISTSVMTTYETELRAEYVEKGGDPDKWPEALGGGFDLAGRDGRAAPRATWYGAGQCNPPGCPTRAAQPTWPGQCLLRLPLRQGYAPSGYHQRQKI